MVPQHSIGPRHHGLHMRLSRVERQPLARLQGCCPVLPEWSVLARSVDRQYLLPKLEENYERGVVACWRTSMKSLRMVWTMAAEMTPSVNESHVQYATPEQEANAMGETVKGDRMEWNGMEWVDEWMNGLAVRRGRLPRGRQNRYKPRGKWMQFLANLKEKAKSGTGFSVSIYFVRMRQAVAWDEYRGFFRIMDKVELRFQNLVAS
ncbi:predicted protein [Plenodomus lingam JN3]|uniref:Predicted protein n=1 Tax=Leptosphaeria maculans (strain JN3 / isolate v23.1.3 / race Av1-4-5-6-7-8) TaxID=985895 RepID=E5A244_LEPMJ|nr:predicted protein [Plenodomus lingam JN3]CBX97761.1 predicted protein [Plenodomus lingam JN3]